MALQTGTYHPASLRKTVEIWPLVKDEDEDSPTYGDMIADEDNLPDGFIQNVNSGDQHYYHLADPGKRGKPVRHLGNAIVLEPGGAVVTLDNGRKYTLTASELRAFELDHTLESDAPDSPEA